MRGSGRGERRIGTVKKNRAGDFAAAAVLFTGSLLLILPYLRTEFTDQPWNNGQIYLAILRIFKDHPWTWNAVHYCGAPLRYLYPPLMHALVIAMPGLSLARAFRVCTGCAFAAAPVCLYFLAKALFESRVAALFAGAAYILFPSFMYLSPTWRNLTRAYGFAPWSFVTFVGYEEAAHVFGFSIALLAALAMWRSHWTAAAILTALVALTSWPALVGLAFPLAGIVAARVRSCGLPRALLSAAATAGVGYGLAAFWLSPDYFVSTSLLKRIVLSQVPVAPAPWGPVTYGLLAGGIVAIAAISILARPSLAFALAWTAAAGAILLAFTEEGTHVFPAPNRYMLELHAGAVLAVSGLLLQVRWKMCAFAAAALAGIWLGRDFLKHPWAYFPKPARAEDGIVFTVTQELNRLGGRSRVFASGEVEETLPLWADRPEVGGTMQDITNFLLYGAQRYVAFGCTDSPDVAANWLRALNIRYVVVHGARSREYYHWYSQPERFAALQVAWTDAHDDWIYDFAGSDPPEAVVVDLDALRSMPPIRAIDDREFLSRYVDWARGKRTANLRWNDGRTEADMDVELGPGEGVLVKTNYAAGWKIPGAMVGADPIGFVIVRSPAGAHRWHLRFGASWPLWLGRAITICTLLLLLLRAPKPWIALAAVAPALTAYLYLLAHLPPGTAIAQKAFASVQPPQIFPGGIVNGTDGFVSVYGVNLGKPQDSVSAYLNGSPVPTAFHSPSLVKFRVPREMPRAADLSDSTVSIEVNGCRGNEFALPKANP